MGIPYELDYVLDSHEDEILVWKILSMSSNAICQFYRLSVHVLGSGGDPLVMRLGALRYRQ